jgi:hypothetical protein
MGRFRQIGLWAATIVVLSVNAASADTRFDGSWTTTLTCENARDALGYSYEFVSSVKDGVLHGLHGSVGTPGYLQIDGRIEPDGISRLYARGQIGSREYAPGRETPRGTEYSYGIRAHFTESSGNGTRLVGRPCTIEFAKQ